MMSYSLSDCSVNIVSCAVSLMCFTVHDTCNNVSMCAWADVTEPGPVHVKAIHTCDRECELST